MMLKSLAMLILAMVFSVSAAETVPAQKNASAKEQQAQGNQSPTVVGEANNSVPAHERDDSTDSAQGWHKFVTWPGSWETWALIVTFGVITWQACLMRSHAKHLSSLAGHIVASERAWVQVSKVSITSGSIDNPQGSRQAFVSCGCVNYGKSPARVLGLNVLLAQGPIDDPENTWNETLYDFKSKTTPKWTIVPAIPKHVFEPIHGLLADPGKELPAPAHGKAYFVHGVLRYWDVFSETDRFTRFCYREDRRDSLLSEGWHVAGGERCNQET